MCQKTYEININIQKNHIGLRLDKVISIILKKQYSRNYLSKLIKNNSVIIDNNIINKPDYKININHTNIKIILPQHQNTNNILIGQDIFDYEIMYEDEHLMIINKPPGIVVHPAPGNWENTIVNALIGRDNHFATKFNTTDQLRPGIVHRLDKDTSGCLIIAKNPTSKYKLSKNFALGKIEKLYSAIVYGKPQHNYKKITTLLNRHIVNRKKMSIVLKNGKQAITIYNVCRIGKIQDKIVGILDIKTLTGRTHQIRVHLAYDKIPILGDKLYGGHQSIIAPRQMLHAYKLVFNHPITNKIISVECPMFTDHVNMLEQIVNI